MCELINTLNVLVSCTPLVHSSGIDKLGHIGACALPIGGCAPPLEVSPTHIKKTTSSCHVLSLRDQYIKRVCGRRLNLWRTEWAMLRLSGQLTVFDSISLGHHQRIRARATPWLQKALICQQPHICMLSIDGDQLQTAPAVPGQLCHAAYATGELRWFPSNK